MRILQLHDESWDSGIAHYALTLADQLRRRGHDVHFWAAEGSHAARQAREAGLAVLELGRPWLGLPRLRAEAARRRFELVNAHTGSSHALGAALCAGGGAALVRTRGDTRPCARHALAKALARRTGSFIAANSRIREELSRAFPGSLVETVFQGLPPAPAAAAAELPEAPVVGLLGRLDPVKGHADFLQAARLLRAELPTARFLAAGADTAGRLAQLRAQAASLGLGGSLEFLGRVQDQYAFIAGCRIGVVASVGSEAVSRAALEWMSAGRPLVATSVGCLPDLVEDGVTGSVVPPGDPAALSRAIGALAGDPALAARMGRAARARFERFFGLGDFAARTERLYEDTLRRVRR